MTELQAMTEYYNGLIEDAKETREAIRHSSNGSMKTLEAFDRLLLALGIFDRVVEQDDKTRKFQWAEMAVPVED
jgi:hypothetical protein